MPEHPHQSGTLLLGIDPGHADGTATVGLCLYDPRARCDLTEAEGGAFRLRTLPLLEALDLIAEAAPTLAVAVLEDARALPIYARHRGKDRGTRDRIARSVGRVDGATSTLEAYLARLGVPYVTRSPQGRRKLDADAFRQLTRYPAAEETTQHERDAAFSVYGYTAAALLREAERHATPTTTTPSTTT